MTDGPSSSTAPWGILPTAPPASLTGARLSRRLLADRVAAIVVRGGGIAIIASILAILFVIFHEVYPLLKSPTQRRMAVVTADSTTPALAVGVDEYRELAFLANAGGLQLHSLMGGRRIEATEPLDLGGAAVTSVSPLGRGPFVLGTSDGRAVPLKVSFTSEYVEGKRTTTPSVIVSKEMLVDPQRRPLRAVAYAADASGGPLVAALVDARELAILAVTETRPLIGEPQREEKRTSVILGGEGDATVLAADLRGDNLFVGDDSGKVHRVRIRGGEPTVVEHIVPREGATIGVLALLIGDRTLVVGDSRGGVSSWQLLRAPKRGERLVRVNEFEAHGAAVTAIAPAVRHKGFITGDAEGELKFRFGTTGETLLSARTEGKGARAIAFGPKADGMLVATETGQIESWELTVPHPETTLRSLFGKVWYEGYERPEYVWQSTGGSDDFEPKLSLTPLIYGTLKGTFYALIIAIPLSLLGALYASQFMHPTLKSYVKPTVEIMAALPSVVLGFIAGLWLAPAVERIVPGLFLMPIVEILLILSVVYVWRFMPSGVRRRIRAGTEVFLLIPLVLFGGWLAIQLGGLLETWMLGGDYRRWLVDVVGLPYDQRNSLVVGLAMGFAVIPIIFTIAEDSLTSVPSHLRAGSLALGATPWQTATRVILPTASPGIFSAVMIGFGRAVGETMIVLMATGNTPVMEASIFSGLRALSANIAVELPEAPEGGTLYRVLFLAAFLLFLTTFVVNTAAELVRLRLRNRFRVL